MNILMIAYYFPPDLSSGSFRPLHFARYLEEMGENVFVLTAREEDFLPYQHKDHTLLDSLNDNVTLVRSRVFHPTKSVITLRDKLFGKATKPTRAQVGPSNSRVKADSKPSVVQEFKDTITDLLTTPDAQIGWLPSAVNAGRKIIREQQIEVMYATGNPWTGLMIGAILKKLTGVPVVLDFRDPWVSNYEFLSKRKLMRSLETRLERGVIAAADHIIANTDELKHDFLHRFPFLTADHVTTIYNGFDTYIDTLPEYSNTTLTLTHTGTLRARSPRCLLQAVLNLIEQDTIPKDAIHLIFLGGISVDDPLLEEILQNPVLQDVIEVLPRMPYQDVVQYQSASDVLFLIQPEHFSLQIPRKLYEYMAFRKPIFGITNPGGATAHIIEKNELGIVAADQVAEIESALKLFYQQWKSGAMAPRAMRKNDESVHAQLKQKWEEDPQYTRKQDKFLNKLLTVKLLNIFRKCCETHVE